MGTYNTIPVCKNLDDDVRKNWLIALRSDKYEQGGAALRHVRFIGPYEPDTLQYCCLGVLADITDDDWRVSTDNPNSFQSHLTEGVNFLNNEFADSIHLEYVDQRLLASMNDAGIDFLDIADMIERGYIKFDTDGYVTLVHSSNRSDIEEECCFDTLIDIFTDDNINPNL